MIRRLAVLLALAGMIVGPAPARAESGYTAISPTDVSATTTLARVATHLTVCNNSTTDRFYVRVFSTADTAAAATTSYTPIPVASSAAYPYCVGIPFGRTDTGVGFWKVSHIAAAGKTPTGFLVYE